MFSLSHLKLIINSQNVLVDMTWNLRVKISALINFRMSTRQALDSKEKFYVNFLGWDLPN